MFGNAPYMTGLPADFAMKGDPGGGFASMQPQAGMFGGGRRRGVDIGQFGAMLLAMNNNPLGIQALQQRSQQQQAQDEFKQREMARQQALSDQRGQFTFEQDYRTAHPSPPEPTQLERLMALAHIDPNSEQGRQMALQAAQNSANPMQGVPYTDAQGNQGIQFVRPGQGGPPPAPAPGEVRGGHRFRGGNPADPNAWEPLAGGGRRRQTRPAPFQGGASGRMLGITAQAESGNRDFRPDGSPVISPAGARFAMQVMPSTAHQPGYGVRPAANESPQEYDRVGRDYWQAMLRLHGGDPARAWAAYNGGPGRTAGALRHGPNWLGAMPPETQGYVRRNMRALGGI